MLKIGVLPSRSTESQLQNLGYISGSRVSHKALLSFATLVLILFSIPLLHHNVPQQKQPTEWLDSLFSRIFTCIQTVIDVEDGMAPYVWYLVERPSGASNLS